MKNHIKIILLLVVVMCCALCFGACSSAAVVNDAYTSSDVVDTGYSITNLDVTIDASKGDRSAHITEKYSIVLREQSRFIDRYIPINSGEQVRNIKVYDIKGLYNKFTVSQNGNSAVWVAVGKDGYHVTGTVSFTLEYTITTPPHAVYPDAFVINAIGQGWSCDIQNAHVKVTLPAETNETPRYYYGKWGVDNNAAEIVTVAPESGLSEYEFSLKADRPYVWMQYYGDEDYKTSLFPYEGLTLYYFLPEGALKTPFNYTMLYIIIAGLLLAAVMVVLKLTIGKNEPLAPVTNYYPPKHTDAKDKDLPMDPVDMGYLIDNKCQGSDVTSLIFYFASRGYLEIIEPENKKKSKNFTLKKLCDIPKGVPDYQRSFFKGLFSTGDEVTTSQLTNRMYRSVQSVQTNITAKYKGKLYDGKAQKTAMAAGFALLLFAVLTVFITGLTVSTKYINLFGLTALAPIVVAGIGMSVAMYRLPKIGKAKSIAIIAVFSVLTAGASLILLLAISNNLLNLPCKLALSSVVTLNGIIIALIARRTEYYNKELNEVLGFKDFLMSAEKDKLETLLEENPQYYYDILPYANVLGVSDIWEDKFNGLTLEPPRYYRGVGVFDLLLFNSMYRHSYNAYSSASTSRPSSSSRSGGGFGGGGGGGFSGGGFGGGGGGRR